jgi:hypothetical protein
VPFSPSRNGWIWPGAAWWLRSLAPREAPRILVSNANVRTIGTFWSRTGAMLAYLPRTCQGERAASGSRCGRRYRRGAAATSRRSVRQRRRNANVRGAHIKVAGMTTNAHSCRNEYFIRVHIYAWTGMLTYGLLDLVRDHRVSFSAIS